MGVFFDISAIITVLVLFAGGFILFNGEHSMAASLRQGSHLTFFISVVIACVKLVLLLAYTDKLTDLGPGLGFSIIIVLYAAVLKVITLLVERFKYAPPE